MVCDLFYRKCPEQGNGKEMKGRLGGRGGGGPDGWLGGTGFLLGDDETF